MLPPDERIYAWGFRNPYRFWVDPMTGLLWIGDVGEVRHEEISVGDKGDHFGWPFWEGSEEYNQSWKPANGCQGVTPATNCVPEVYDYPHSSGNNCVIGGLIPSGCGWTDEWKQRYFFGDHGSGRVWTIDVDADRMGADRGSVTDFASTNGIGSFRMGPDGAMYLVEVDGGAVQRLTPVGWDPASCEPEPPIDPDASTGTGGQGQGGTGDGGAAGGPAGGGAPPGGGGTPSGAGGTSGAGATAGGGGDVATVDGGVPGSGSGDDGGCGCRVAARDRSGAGLAALVSAVALGALRRRRRARA
jgi:MYXO-CTERM domain-containing protein